MSALEDFLWLKHQARQAGAITLKISQVGPKRLQAVAVLIERVVSDRIEFESAELLS